MKNSLFYNMWLTNSIRFYLKVLRCSEFNNFDTEYWTFVSPIGYKQSINQNTKVALWVSLPTFQK